MILVYRYGLCAPTSNAELVREQMRLAHRYRYTLVEIERGRRAALRALLSSHGDVQALEVQVAGAEKRVERALVALKAAKAQARSRAVPVDLRDALTEARIGRRDALAALREARRSLRGDESLTARREEIEETAKALRRNARAHCGVYWGTYLLVESEDDAARKVPLYDGAKPNDPHFPRWSGEGTVQVQVQGGADVGAVVDGSNQLVQIVRVADRNAARGSTRFALLRLRVGSDGRAPVWADFPMVMHREMPPGARIKWAAVHVRRIGPREEWYATITIDVTACAPRRQLGSAGAVAVDLGWRERPGETIRVGCWVGEDGEQGEVLLDARTVSGLRLPESLRSTRDENFNRARAELAGWMSGRDDLPGWFTEATAHLGAWRSPARLAALARRWRANRWAGDGGGFDALERWRYHDDHLWRWECDQRSGALRHRREVYRVIAATLARRYSHLVLEDVDWRVLSKRPAADDPEGANEVARSNRQRVAVSDLAGCLRDAFGSAASKVSAVDTTHECAACSTVNAFDAAAELHHRCSGCGALWDQDYNAARGLLARHLREWQRDARGAGPSRDRTDDDQNGAARTSKWGRARRAKAEKQEREVAARSAACNAPT